MDWWRIVCCAAAGYLLGSCNGAIVVSHTCMHDDIRKKGSGNAGCWPLLCRRWRVWRRYASCCHPF